MEVPDVGAHGLERLAGGGKPEAVARMCAGRAHQPCRPVAVDDDVLDLAVDIRHARPPLTDQGLERLAAGDVAHRTVVDEVLSEELVGGIEIALVDDLVEHPMERGLHIRHRWLPPVTPAGCLRRYTSPSRDSDLDQGLGAVQVTAASATTP